MFHRFNVNMFPIIKECLFLSFLLLHSWLVISLIYFTISHFATEKRIKQVPGKINTLFYVITISAWLSLFTANKSVKSVRFVKYLAKGSVGKTTLSNMLIRTNINNLSRHRVEPLSLASKNYLFLIPFFLHIAVFFQFYSEV